MFKTFQRFDNQSFIKRIDCPNSFDSFLKIQKSMYKSSFLIFLFMSFWGAVRAQVTPTSNMFQSSMAPFQATALPYNCLDKFERQQSIGPTSRSLHRPQKPNLNWYFNASTRIERYPEMGINTAAGFTNTAANYASSVVSLDFIQNPDSLSVKIGGGVLYNDLQIVRLISPFGQVSVHVPIGEYWRILGGVNYRFAQPRRTNEILDYRDEQDPSRTKLKNQEEAFYKTIYQSFGVSAALTHTEKYYFGIGMNRLFNNNQFATAEKSNFTEFNLLCQAVLWKSYKHNFARNKETGKRTENPSRGFLSNVSLSVAARYLIGTPYPYAQVSCRTTLMSQLWIGAGWNTANRVQFQVGFMKLPIFKQDVVTEWSFWLGYDLPTRNTPYHGFEINGGCYF
jgi:Type IX secretion system membrane protein PorP/SprF